jgi:methylated-DNA-[protein]-cysteine S-methyltransferase
MCERPYYTVCASPLGELLLLSDGEALTGLYLEGHRGGPVPGSGWRRDDGPFRAVRAQLEAYFAGDLRTFDVPVTLGGTDFQRQVWSELQRVPYGATASYGELAARLGRPSAARAVGAANGRNPISIIVPCHRVVGADGALTGYAGGLERKRWLLAWEAKVLAGG